MIELPKACVVDKFLPKKLFYENVNITNPIKEEFVEKLNKIYWKYKISEDNINISKTENVEEIEIFELELKEKYICKNIIKIITRNISYPILFLIKYENEFQYAIKYNEDIYFNDWNKELFFDFNALNLEIIYNNIVKSITNIDKSVKHLDYEIQKQNEILKMENEIKKLESKIHNEKQFNIKVEYNQKINEIKSKIEKIKSNML